MREITFKAKVDDEKGSLSVSRSSDKDDTFTSLEMIGILETMKHDILNGQFPESVSNTKSKDKTL